MTARELAATGTASTDGLRGSPPLFAPPPSLSSSESSNSKTFTSKEKSYQPVFSAVRYALATMPETRQNIS
eukprot:1355404-Amphidinium_carterae.1